MRHRLPPALNPFGVVALCGRRILALNLAGGGAGTAICGWAIDAMKRSRGGAAEPGSIDMFGPVTIVNIASALVAALGAPAWYVLGARFHRDREMFAALEPLTHAKSRSATAVSAHGTATPTVNPPSPGD